MNCSKSTMALFVDMTKAFDMVDHDLLLKKLYNAGFRGGIQKWFTSYLKDRKQKVNINGSFSDTRTLKNGVPQGSVLGPLLFLIYINSLFELNLNGLSTAFADDIAFTYQFNTVFECIAKISEDLETLRLWFAEHKLIISEKTKLMSFKISNNVLNDFNLCFHAYDCKKFCLPVHCCGKSNFVRSSHCSNNCFKIESVHHYKYLGVLIDHNLNWKDHIQTVKSHMLVVTRKMYLIKPHCSQKVLKSIYYGLAHSKLQYGIASWGGSYSSSFRPLLIAQKHLIRIVCNKNRFNQSWPLFRDLRILPMRHLYVFKVLKEFFKQSGNIPSRTTQL